MIGGFDPKLTSQQVAKAVQLSGTEAGAIYVHDEHEGEFNLRSTYGMSDELIAGLKEHHIGVGDTIARATEQRTLVQMADLRNEPTSPVIDLVLRAGYRALLVVPQIGRAHV